MFRRILLRFIRRCVTQKKVRSVFYVDYTVADFRTHIEKKFKAGMTWYNYGQWHIDHIKPLYSFEFYDKDGKEDIGQIKAANSLNNLQPLWAAENLSKWKKI